MEEKKLLQSQADLLHLRMLEIRKAEAMFQQTLDQIALELGVLPGEKGEWEINGDLNTLYRQRDEDV